LKLIPDSKFLKVKYIPNYISLFRLLLIFPIIYLLEFNHLKYIWILLIIAGIADYLDGLANGADIVSINKNRKT